MPPKFHSLPVRSVRAEGSHALSLVFDVPPELHAQFVFQAGQYLTLQAEVNGQPTRRSYSLCSAPHEGELRVAVKRVAGGAFSNWVRSLKAGDVLQVMPPDGRFGAGLLAENIAEKDSQNSVNAAATTKAPKSTNTAPHLAFFAAGSGITPVLSLIKTALHSNPRARCTLVYANQRQSSAMFLEALEDLKNRYLSRLTVHYVFSREAQDVSLLHGRLDAEKTALFLNYLIDPKALSAAYICGPEGMIDAVQSALEQAGLAAKRIHTERFGSGIAASKPKTTPPTDTTALADTDDIRIAHVAITADGVTRELVYEAEDTSLLSLGLKNGMDLPYSCLGGVCSTCRCKLVSGQVHMPRNFALTAQEVTAGFILSCQAQPTSPEVVVSFDQR